MDSDTGFSSSLLRLALVALCAIVAGCNPKYYSPTTQNIPLLRGAGEFSGAATAGADRFEAQVAYGVTNHLGLQLNAGALQPDDEDNGNGGSGKFVEGGVGYFHPRPSGLTLAFYALLAFGSFENHLPSTVSGNPGTTGDLEGSLVRVAIQPVLGYRSTHFEAALSSRVSSLSYRDLSGDLIFDNEDQVKRLRDGGSYLLLEPALTLRAGPERVKLQLQAGTSHNLTDADFPQDESTLTLGVFLRLPR